MRIVQGEGSLTQKNHHQNPGRKVLPDKKQYNFSWRIKWY